MRTVALHRSIDVVGACLTHGVVELINFRIFLGPVLVDALGQILGDFHTGAHRQFECDTQTAVIAGWEEFRTDELGELH